MKISIIGSRGIPAKYGGFETFTEIVSSELAKKGHNIYVSCEHSKEKKDQYKGVNLFYFPMKPPKNPLLRIIYEFMYDGYSLLWASIRTDYVYMLGYSAAMLFFIPRLFGKQLLINPDGMEWKRNKFNPLIKSLLKLSERIAIFWSNTVIADSEEIKKYLDAKYNINSVFIPYGASSIKEVKWESKKLPENLKHININPSYYLVVARLEPENNIDKIIKGYLMSKTEIPLIVVGNFADPNYKSLINDMVDKSPKGKKVIFAGAIYNYELLNMLRQNCKAYIHGHSVGGTNPSLLEGMISKNLIIAHNNVFNAEVCGDNAIYFEDAHELSEKFEFIENNYINYSELKNGVYDRARIAYTWPRVINQYNIVFSQLSDVISTFDKLDTENKKLMESMHGSSRLKKEPLNQ